MANLAQIIDSEMRTELAGYSVDSEGIICSPGKMEGEPLYVPYFWAQTMDGCCETLDATDANPHETFIIDITERDREIFPELGANTYALLWEDDNGFVYCDTETRA